MQDDIAEDMIRMACSLRDNSLIAKDIIIGDNKVRGTRTIVMVGVSDSSLVLWL